MTRGGGDAFDPRARTAAGLLALAALLAAPRGAAAAALLPALLLAAVSLDGRRFRAMLAAAALLAAFTVAINALFVPGERLGPGALGWLRPSRTGLQAGALLGARVAALAAVGAWLASRVRAMDLLTSLEWSVRNRDAWRRRVAAAGLPVLLALRLVPILAEEATRLVEIERLRFGPLPWHRRTARLGALAPVWMLCALDRASDLALALTLRGHRPGAPRGFARDWPWRWRDGLLTAAGGALLAAAVLA